MLFNCLDNFQEQPVLCIFPVCLGRVHLSQYLLITCCALFGLGGEDNDLFSLHKVVIIKGDGGACVCMREVYRNINIDYDKRRKDWWLRSNFTEFQIV